MNLPTSYVTPARDDRADLRDAFVCPKCGVRSQHLRLALSVLAWTKSSGIHEPFDDEREHTFVRQGLESTGDREAVWTAAVCMGCRRASVWRDDSLVYPRPRASIAPHPDMPEPVRDLFVEATEVLPLSRRAAAALGRASLEVLLKHLFPDSTARDLQGRIAELHAHVRPMLWKLLTALRVVGNDSLHDGHSGVVALWLEGDDADMIEPLLRAINLLVEELITQPAEADEIYLRIPEAKRAAAETAAAKLTDSV